MSLSRKSLAKARRLVDEGRVVDMTATRSFAVHGDHGDHGVTLSAGGAACDCPAWVVPCSHIRALLMTTSNPPRAASTAEPLAAQPARGRLYTWSWRAALNTDPPGVTLVRISLGMLKWVPTSRTAAIPYIEELAPVGGLFHLDGDEFVLAYRKRLDSSVADRIASRFRDVAAGHGALPLVLLCVERSPADCHRGDFADWWLERTGEIVSEYESTG